MRCNKELRQLQRKHAEHVLEKGAAKTVGWDEKLIDRINRLEEMSVI